MARQDPYSSYRFRASIGNLTQVRFTECQGLEIEIEYEELAEGGLNNFVHRLPKRVSRFPNLVFKRGLAQDELWAWHARTVDGMIQRRQLTITLFGYAGMPKMSWNVIDALPIKWAGPNFNAGENQVAFETLEVVHNGIKLVSSR